jgi:hypothetical protein
MVSTVFVVERGFSIAGMINAGYIQAAIGKATPADISF